MNQMYPALRLHNRAHLTLLQTKRRLLERFLHISSLKVSEVAALARTSAVRFRSSQVAERNFSGANARFMAAQDLARLVLAAGDVAFAPAAGPARLAVFEQQVGDADLVAAGPASAAAGAGTR